MRKPSRVAGIIIKNNSILLVYRKKEGKEYYVFPGGGVEDNENNKQSLIRELSEETSVEISIDKLLYKHNYESSKQYYYLCSYVSGNPKLRKDSVEKARNEKGMDLYKPLWINIKKLPKLLVYPLEIRDWLIEDIKNDFQHTPRKASLNVSELRQS